VTVAEVVQRLMSALPATPRVTFRELTRHASSRTEVVVHFLGVLELYKQGLVHLDQAVTFGELLVTWVGAGPDEEGAVLDELVASSYFGGRLSDLEYRG